LTKEGGSQSQIVATLVKSIERPSREMIKLRKEVKVVKKSHFSPLINKPALANFLKIAQRYQVCSSFKSKKIRMSSI
jgi:pantoate kinase